MYKNKLFKNWLLLFRNGCIYCIYFKLTNDDDKLMTYKKHNTIKMNTIPLWIQ